MGNEKRIFIAATRQNDGKTVISIGLLLALRKRLSRIRFIKPVGQKYLLVENQKVDKDAVLLRNLCGFPCALKDMNPVAVEEGFTRAYLDNPDSAGLLAQITQSYRAVAQNAEFVVIEGTGHAGVGSVFDLSNATVAKALDAPVVLITIGGIGRPVDEVCLNRALLQQAGCEIKGVIVNKVMPEKMHTIRTYLTRAFDRLGLPLLGLIPFAPLLTVPNFAQICESVNGIVLAGAGRMHRKVQRVIVGAMTPRHALDHFLPQSVLVTPGDREDLILAALSHCAAPAPHGELIIGLVLTGGLRPHKSILHIITQLDFPTILANEGTYEVTSRIHELVVKVREEDSDKIALAEELVEKYVDIDALIS